MFSNLQGIYKVFTVFDKVLLNQCQTVSKTFYLNRLFGSFVMLLHTGFVWKVNSTGDIPYTEMSVDLQSNLYEIEKVHDFCMSSDIIVYLLCWYKYVC